MTSDPCSVVSVFHLQCSGARSVIQLPHEEFTSLDSPTQTATAYFQSKAVCIRANSSDLLHSVIICSVSNHQQEEEIIGVFFPASSSLTRLFPKSEVLNTQFEFYNVEMCEFLHF